MNQVFKLKPYKGYIGTVVPEVELGYYRGVVCDIPMIIEYESDKLSDLQEEFEMSVDEYLRIVGLE